MYLNGIQTQSPHISYVYMLRFGIKLNAILESSMLSIYYYQMHLFKLMVNVELISDWCWNEKLCKSILMQCEHPNGQNIIKKIMGLITIQQVTC
jgi:hypothetical protein